MGNFNNSYLPYLYNFTTYFLIQIIALTRKLPRSSPQLVAPNISLWKDPLSTFGTQGLHIVLTFSDHYVKGKVFSPVVSGAPEL